MGIDETLLRCFRVEVGQIALRHPDERRNARKHFVERACAPAQRSVDPRLDHARFERDVLLGVASGDIGPWIELLIPPVLAHAEPYLQAVGHVDLIDGIDAEERRRQVVDHAAMRRIAQEDQAGRRQLRDDRRIDVGDVLEVGGGAVVADR